MVNQIFSILLCNQFLFHKQSLTLHLNKQCGTSCVVVIKVSVANDRLEEAISMHRSVLQSSDLVNSSSISVLWLSSVLQYVNCCSLTQPCSWAVWSPHSPHHSLAERLSSSWPALTWQWDISAWGPLPGLCALYPWPPGHPATISQAAIPFSDWLLDSEESSYGDIRSHPQ